MPQTHDRTARRSPLNHDPEAVAWARAKQGVTQAWLAGQVGISPSLMSEIESGTRNASPDRLKAIAEALNCPITVLERKRTADTQ